MEAPNGAQSAMLLTVGFGSCQDLMVLGIEPPHPLRSSSMLSGVCLTYSSCNWTPVPLTPLHSLCPFPYPLLSVKHLFVLCIYGPICNHILNVPFYIINKNSFPESKTSIQIYI